MKPIPRKAGRKAAFTIIELLTVMSIIVILVGLIVPSLNMVRRYAKRVKQKAQFHTIDVSLELFYNEWDGYPPSGATDPDGILYCGAMKLAEAMLGQDLQGFDPTSRFRRDGMTGPLPDGTPIYGQPGDDLSGRRKYLSLERASFYRLKEAYHRFPDKWIDIFGNDAGPTLLLCDEYKKVYTADGRKMGMPILYYAANTSGSTHAVKEPPFGPPKVVNPSSSIGDPTNIFNYRDNDALVQVGFPWVNLTDINKVHPMAAEGSGITLHPTPNDEPSPYYFYNLIWNRQIYNGDPDTGIFRPYRAVSYILVSAGFDGEYGTKDDVFNFERKGKE